MRCVAIIARMPMRRQVIQRAYAGQRGSPSSLSLRCNDRRTHRVLGDREHDLDRQYVWWRWWRRCMSISWCWRCFSGPRPLGLKTFRPLARKGGAISAVLAANQGALSTAFSPPGCIWGLVQGVPAFAFQIKTVLFALRDRRRRLWCRDRQPQDPVGAGRARGARAVPALAGVSRSPFRPALSCNAISVPPVSLRAMASAEA